MTIRPKVPVRRPRRPPPKLYIGQWLKRLGMKQVEIARACDIGESHMSLIVSGDKYPSPGLLAEVARAMGVPEHVLRQQPPDEATVRATAGLDPAVLARLGQHLPPKS
jgi:transcriptional regulator with XRE-family HTH domain